MAVKNESWEVSESMSYHWLVFLKREGKGRKKKAGPEDGLLLSTGAISFSLISMFCLFVKGFMWGEVCLEYNLLTRHKRSPFFWYLLILFFSFSS